MQIRTNTTSVVLSPCFIFLAILFCSCSDPEPSIGAINATMMLKFSDYGTLPDTKLVVFIEVLSDVQYASTVHLIHVQSNYEWIETNPVVIKNGDKQWIGGASFMMPSFQVFPMGTYKIEYTDTQERICSGIFDIQYQSELAYCTADRASELLNTKK